MVQSPDRGRRVPDGTTARRPPRRLRAGRRRASRDASHARGGDEPERALGARADAARTRVRSTPSAAVSEGRNTSATLLRGCCCRPLDAATDAAGAHRQRCRRSRCPRGARLAPVDSHGSQRPPELRACWSSVSTYSSDCDSSMHHHRCTDHSGRRLAGALEADAPGASRRPADVAWTWTERNQSAAETT